MHVSVVSYMQQEQNMTAMTSLIDQHHLQQQQQQKQKQQQWQQHQWQQQWLRLTKTRGVHSNRTFGNGTKDAILGNNLGNSYRQAMSARTAAAAEREAEKKEGVERTVIGTLVRVR